MKDGEPVVLIIREGIDEQSALNELRKAYESLEPSDASIIEFAKVE